MKPLIVLGVTGSVAAVRSFDLCREFRRHGFEVQVVMSDAATGIITEEAMEFASGRKVITKISGKVEHVKLFGRKGKAKLFLIAPATANTISKTAMGIDDTPVTTFATVAIGSGRPVLLAPAMHEPMYEHPIVKDNLEKLRQRGVKVIAPLMEEGKAKLHGINGIVFEVEKALGKGKLKGKKVLVASGAFSEKVDSARVITNLSSGKMGSAVAVACGLEGAEVKIIGNGEHADFIHFEQAHYASELEEKVLAELVHGYDYFYCPAAIPDFTAKQKKGKMISGKKIRVELEPRKKLVEAVRERFPKLRIIAFKATFGKRKREIERIARGFRKGQGLAAVVANDLAKSPFGAEETEVFVCGKKEKWLKGKKAEVAKLIAGLVG